MLILRMMRKWSVVPYTFPYNDDWDDMNDDLDDDLRPFHTVSVQQCSSPLPVCSLPCSTQCSTAGKYLDCETFSAVLHITFSPV